ncbi:amino-acid N-acetyltransferase [Spirochaetia bacterium 38H-sp]|uniref:amino-acid N-acetyltransferase n=1 Tax=Rarispira pelagica TaxID=3141764 RepID=A0ABU9UCG5_9SPIR
MKLQKHIELIREVFHYLRRYNGAVFVIKVDYGVLSEERAFMLVSDIALLKQAGIHVVLVPGAKQRIDQVCSQYGISWEEKDGIRISSDEAMPFIEMAAFDVSTRLMTILTGHGINAVVGNWVRALGLGVIDGVDYMRTGRVDRVDIEPVNKLLKDGLVPIFPCVGWNSRGKAYNISSNELAMTIASQLAADKLFYVLDSFDFSSSALIIPPDVETGEGGVISKLTVSQAEQLCAINPKGTPGLEHISHAAAACRSGVERVHIVDGRVDGALLKEIFSNVGMGLMVHSHEFESIRPMAEEDIPDVLRIMEPLIEQGILLPRSREQMLREYRSFYVYDIDGSVHACAALYLYGSDGELGGLAVDSAYAGSGIGSKLTRFIIEQARSAGLKRLFALTTRAVDWFESLGFSLTSPDSLPEERKARYTSSRKSRVYVLNL